MCVGTWRRYIRTVRAVGTFNSLCLVLVGAVGTTCFRLSVRYDAMVDGTLIP